MEQMKMTRLETRHILGSAILVVGLGATFALMLGAPKYQAPALASVQQGACAEADTAAIAALKPLMQRTDQRATLTSSSAFKIIADARRNCWNNDGDRAAQLYAMATQAIARAESGVAAYED